MRIFTLDDQERMIPFNEVAFKIDNKEADLEILLEKNPEYFFEESNLLIIGRQVPTNLNTFIDLLGIDKYGNTVVIELKRERTPRETIAQILEYASFIENLDYEQLNQIFTNYTEEEIGLDEYHKQFFSNGTEEKISFNKSTRLVIVAEEISREVKQSSQYLRRKGLDLYCIEFRYFLTNSGERLISSDFVVSGDEFIRQNIKLESLPKINEKEFIDSLDNIGRNVFSKVIEFCKQEDLLIRWGSRGFSVSIQTNNKTAVLFYSYPPGSVFLQSIYTGFENIRRHLDNAEPVVDYYKSELSKLNCFVQAGSNLKWVLKDNNDEKKVDRFLEIIKSVKTRILEIKLTDIQEL